MDLYLQFSEIILQVCCQNEKEHDKYHLKYATLAKCIAVLD